MDDVKKTYREGEQTTKEAWRQADGDDSLADKVGNAGDEIRKDLGNAGDDAQRRGRAVGRTRKPARGPTATTAWPTRSATPATTCAATMGTTASPPSFKAKKPPLCGGFFASPAVTRLRGTAGGRAAPSIGVRRTLLTWHNHSARGDRPMPQKAWSDKRERQYEHIKESYEDRGVGEDEAEERAARTVNKTRAEHGETKSSRSKRS